MREVLLCLAMIPILLSLFFLSGHLIVRFFHLEMNRMLTLLLGVFVYFGTFQLLAEPMILLKQPLSLLCICWIGVLCVVLLFSAVFLGRSRAANRNGHASRTQTRPCMGILQWIMLLVMALQFYYIITNDYLGWDTSSYVGAITTSLARNSMYLYNGESGKISKFIDFRYALSAFYMHSAVWCRVLGVRAIFMAKIVQGGLLSILNGILIYQIGQFLFSGGLFRTTLSGKELSNAASGMVLAVTGVNVFFQSIYTSSDFLLSRGLEAKAWCANLVLPCIFLYGIMLWRDCRDRNAKISLFAASFSSVAISMSALMTAPALVTLVLLPVLLRDRKMQTVRYYLLCVLPNLLYLIVYVLFLFEKLRIEV